MAKKIIFGILLLSIAGAAIYFFYFIEEKMKPVSNAYNAIPINAVFILESKNIRSSSKKLAETSIIWSDFKETTFISELAKNLNYCDSIFSLVPGAYDLLKGNSFLISAHSSGSRSYDYLHTFPIKNTNQNNVITALLNKAIVPDSVLQNKTYEGHTINILTFLNAAKPYYYSIHNGVFSGSFSSLLVEDAIRQNNNKINLLSLSSFKKLSLSSGENTEGVLYLNFKETAKYFQKFFAPAAAETFKGMGNIADWTSLDITLKPNAVLLSGFTTSNDSIYKFINLFQYQKPGKISIVEVCPSNTATLWYYGFNDFKKLFIDYGKYVESNFRINTNQSIEMLNKKYKINIQDQYLNYIDDEMAVVAFNLNETAGNLKYISSFKIKNKTNALSSIKKLNKSVYKIKESISDSLSHQGFEINSFGLSKFCEELFGFPFNHTENNYYSIIDDYLLFGPDKESMKYLIDNYITGSTLKNTPSYREYIKENTIEQANVYIYSNVAASFNIYKNIFSKEHVVALDSLENRFKNIEAISLQISPGNNHLMYSNLYIKHNPNTKKEVRSIWELALDTGIVYGPFAVTNHNTNAKEFFIQDEANQVYLVSNTGKILWKRKLSGKIISPTYQIDALKNKKLQLLFNTEKEICLIDRNGNDVKGFPIQLPANASCGISVFDYDNQRDYRILAPCKNNTVYNYNENGQLANKWNYKKTNAPVISPVKHVRVNAGDYLVFYSADKKLTITNRRGEIIHEIHRFPLPEFDISPSKEIHNIKFTGIDSSGRVIKTGLQKNSTEIIREKSGKKEMVLLSNIDENDANELLVCDIESFTGYNISNNALFSMNLSKNELPQIGVHPGTGTKKYISLSFKDSKEIFLIDESGKSTDGFPVFGNITPSLGFFNNDNQLFLITGSGKYLFIYQVAQ